tara:strand:+ start:1762 stop:2079 length:318 start_codon:yes stop_codon:yes gene_type:complete
MNTITLRHSKIQTNMKQMNFNNSHSNLFKSKLKVLNEQKTKNIKKTTKVMLNISKGDIEFIKDFHEEMKKCCKDFFEDLDENDVSIVTTLDIEHDDDDDDDFFSN